jgi:hypothetical protein
MKMEDDYWQIDEDLEGGDHMYFKLNSLCLLKRLRKIMKVVTVAGHPAGI